ncbi:MAG: hypothetical protein F9K32_14065 [Desulfobulbaceae bacterium]|nr:MAG: hypothetical protein F9K32_14065 [Desulfobulbaceae bacterium]
MENYLFVTIDTEEDEWNSVGILNPSVKNIHALLYFQERCDSYRVIPTYLINYPVATAASSRKVIERLLSQGNCEIGTHCHPWNTPPLKEEQTKANSYLCNLPQELVEQKLTVMHDTIKANFGISPKVFRAGRWGFGKFVLANLARLGYTVDTSITPFHSWSDSIKIDYKCKANQAFFLSSTESVGAVIRDNGKIMEVPPTMGYLQRNDLLCHKIYNVATNAFFKRLKLNGLLDKLGLVNFRWLSPEFSDENEMIKLTEKQFGNNGKFVNMFFHSSTLQPGLTPFVRNQHDLDVFNTRLDTFFQYVVTNKIQSLPLSKAGLLC